MVSPAPAEVGGGWPVRYIGQWGQSSSVPARPPGCSILATAADTELGRTENTQHLQTPSSRQSGSISIDPVLYVADHGDIVSHWPQVISYSGKTRVTRHGGPRDAA